MIQHLSNLSNKSSLKLGQLNIWKLETTTLRPYLITLLCPLVNKNSRLERNLFARKTIYIVDGEFSCLMSGEWRDVTASVNSQGSRCQYAFEREPLLLKQRVETWASLVSQAAPQGGICWMVGMPSHPAFFRGRTVELQGELVTSGTSWFPYRLKATSSDPWSSKRLGSSRFKKVEAPKIEKHKTKDPDDTRHEIGIIWDHIPWLELQNPRKKQICFSHLWKDYIDITTCQAILSGTCEVSWKSFLRGIESNVVRRHFLHTHTHTSM